MSNFPSDRGFPTQYESEAYKEPSQRPPSSSDGLTPGGGKTLVKKLIQAAINDILIAMVVVLLYLLYAIFQEHAPSQLRPGQVIGRLLGDVREAFSSVNAPTNAQIEATSLAQQNAAKIQIQELEARLQERIKILEAQLEISKQAAIKNYEIGMQYQKLQIDIISKIAEARLGQVQSQEQGRGVAIMLYDIAGMFANAAGRDDMVEKFGQARQEAQTASTATLRGGVDDIHQQLIEMNNSAAFISPVLLGQQLSNPPIASAPFPQAPSAPLLQGTVVSPLKK